MVIPEPFKLYDETLLNYVFNPIAWNIEWYTGKTPPFLAMVSFFVGQISLIIVGVIHLDFDYFTIAEFVFLGLLAYTSVKKHADSYKRNTATGLNILRTYFMIRVLMQLIIFATVAATRVIDKRSAFLSILICACFFCIFIIPQYFCACDRLPPEFKQTAPQVA